MSDQPHPRDSSPPEVIEAAAAAWLSLRDRGMSAAETAEFMRWLQQDPQHAVVFAELDRVWKDCDRLAVVPLAATGARAPDGDLLAPRVRPRRHRPRAWVALGAAATVAMLLWVAGPRPSRPAHETAVGAFQKLDLPDGSVAQLNTDSALELSFTASERRLRIVRGEVFFSVVGDPARPFIVTIGPVEVRAVGTAFNVRRHAAAVEVLVTEGRVRVDDVNPGRSLLTPASATPKPTLLSAGERAMVAVVAEPSVAAIEKLSPIESQRLLAWQERRLEFDAVPLADVVREFNRYNRRQLVIADPALATKRFSGIFRADGYESLVRLLETDFGVVAVRSERAIDLRAIR